MNVFWTTFNWGDWHFYLAATDKGVCYIHPPDKPFADVKKWVQKNFPENILIEAPEKNSEAVEAITSYLDGHTEVINIPLHITGTKFQQYVWKKMSEVPYGQTKTYTDIALKIGNKKAVRAVASAIGKNPLMIILPCHRIIAKNGNLAGYRGGLHMKKSLLQLEKSHTQTVN